MSKKIILGLIQDKYTNLILYDESTRCDGNPNWITINDINSIDITFKNSSSFLNTDHNFRFSNTKYAYVIPYGNFIPFDGSDYNNTKYIVYDLNGDIVTISCNKKINNAQEMIDYLFEYVEGTGLDFYREGEKIYAYTINGFIKILDGNLLENLCFNKGVYRDNDFRWNNINATQEELKFELLTDSIDLLNELPEGYLDIQITLKYNDNGTEKTYISEWTEFLYMQTEIYRAKIFEYIANNFTEFLEVKQRWQTDFEIFMQKSTYYDALYKAFLSSLEIGDKERSYELLNYLINYKTLNPII